MLHTSIITTRLDALAADLRLTKRQRAFGTVRSTLTTSDAQALRAIGGSKGSLSRNNPKIRRYVDEVIAINREAAVANGEIPLPTSDEVIRRMGLRARVDVGGFLDFDDSGNPRFNLKRAIDAGLGVCIKSVRIGPLGEIDVTWTEGATADAHLARWLGIDKAVVPTEDPNMRLEREALRMLLAQDPERAKQLESMSIEVDRYRLTIKRGDA